MKGWLYFIRAGSTDWIKIGHAEDRLRRLSFLQSGNHEKLMLVASFSCGIASERRVHAGLVCHERRGEWYRWTPVLQTFLDDLISSDGDLDKALRTHREARRAERLAFAYSVAAAANSVRAA